MISSSTVGAHTIFVHDSVGDDSHARDQRPGGCRRRGHRRRNRRRGFGIRVGAGEDVDLEFIGDVVNLTGAGKPCELWIRCGFPCIGSLAHQADDLIEAVDQDSTGIPSVAK
jgi:hypothetical protein